IDGTYTFTQARSQARGFDGATFGSPMDVTWARGDYTPAHELTLQAGYQSNWIVFTMAGKVSSGLPYTPMVGNDVNGDGSANDRAFIFSAANANNSALTAALDRLMASTTRNARDCLERQRGTAAERNSCTGPWFTTLNLSLAPSFSVMQKLHLARRGDIRLAFSNPLAGIDQLLHGDKLRGWGTAAIPDRVLYYVRGFDSTAKRYVYEVNPRFGDTRPSVTAFRTPFRMTLDVRIDFSRDGEAQQLDRILNPGRKGNPGVKLDSTAIIKRYCGNLPNWYNEVLAETDSLLLTRDQVEGLRAAQADYSGRITHHWATWANALAGLPDQYNSSDLVKRQNTVINDGWEIARQEAHTTLPKILSPTQLKLLPGNAGMLQRAPQPLTGIRYFSTAAC
ncbi:MAG TPA: hypothetical protein VK636_06430, partial [Gemmatimonadaceae bacterium]|nr:hypothetical protein [Gemmatimonadaceae bacterium]